MTHDILWFSDASHTTSNHIYRHRPSMHRYRQSHLPPSDPLTSRSTCSPKVTQILGSYLCHVAGRCWRRLSLQAVEPPTTGEAPIPPGDSPGQTCSSWPCWRGLDVGEGWTPSAPEVPQPFSEAAKKQLPARTTQKTPLTYPDCTHQQLKHRAGTWGHPMRCT